MALAVLMPVAASAQALPPEWTMTGVGSPALPGSASMTSSGVFTVAGSGSDIGGKSDQFTYVYQRLSGDGIIVAKVASLQRAHNLSKAGLMIRESLAPNARHAFVHATAKGIAFQRRLVPGAAAVTTSGGNGSAPIWVRLERGGSRFVAFRSTDGVSWTEFASDTVPMTGTVYVGFAVTSRDTSAVATAVFDKVLFQQAALVNQPPTVSLSSPVPSAIFMAPATIAMAASASDPDGTVAQVDFFQGATLLATDTTVPYAWTWSGVPAGTYSITAVARDNLGRTATTPAVAVSVGTVPVNQPPTVSLTSPAIGATFTSPATIALSANATDADGTISRVDFYNGSVLLGTDTTSPYSITWANVPAGSYALQVTARDNAGAMASSAPRTVVVAATALPRTAIFAASPDHNSTVTRYALEIFVAGSNPGTASPVATQDLGKPAVVNGDCTADISQTVIGLLPGTYFATVSAIGSTGTARSAPSSQFVR